jgi:hypothetical protein
MGNKLITTCKTCLLSEQDPVTNTIYCPLSKEYVGDEDSCESWVGYDDYRRVIRKSK